MRLRLLVSLVRGYRETEAKLLVDDIERDLELFVYTTFKWIKQVHFDSHEDIMEELRFGGMNV